ncbi:retrotransposon protein, putative, Ty3-gypsy subclass [Panicum miliaceum]|uniref:Retrotransposon protein, putative, Ty3-gypsy subclass n=1 Tax=Panicum miliaceum TaxID=4540 RepID=A0A3L6Q8M8_PANMI|nr:retrotransposon protein, putative, Ty3-gypsy subclass [Panicum miliaceum]
MAATYPRLVVLLDVTPTPETIDKLSRRYNSKARDPEEEDNPWEAKATRGQYSGATRKRKPEDQVANVERNPHSKKSGKLQDLYEKILHKQCPMHPKAKHTMFQCTILRKSLNAPPPLDDEEKDKDKGDEGNDKSGPPGFQHPTNTVNVIFGGEDGILTKRAQKLFRREIMSVQPAVPRPLRHNEVPICFSREDQWIDAEAHQSRSTQKHKCKLEKQVVRQTTRETKGFVSLKFRSTTVNPTSSLRAHWT